MTFAAAAHLMHALNDPAGLRAAYSARRMCSHWTCKLTNDSSRPSLSPDDAAAAQPAKLVVVATQVPELAPNQAASPRAPQARLGEWAATAICGNDISSSCLYVSALAVLYAGRYAPVVLLMVAGVLFLFRKVYAEVGEALPLNGGAYNCLLNTTSKFRASMAACMTILSYMATAVISASEAMHYAHRLLPDMSVNVATVGLLAFFAALVAYGIGESAKAAMVIFSIHLATLTVLGAIGVWTLIGDPSVLIANWQVEPEGGIAKALFFGFGAALLGTSGFESSANFIEEQKRGVFPKTLRNMWLTITVFNPLMCIIVLAVMPIAAVSAHTEDALAHAGAVMGGPWLGTLISLDATLVLSGAVLTSFIGVTGLVRRMTLDRTLPQVLLRENRWRGTNHFIILTFFLLCVSVLAVSRGDVTVLAGVYLVSFLGVMALFALGNMLLKVKRGRLRRSVRAPWLTVIVAFLAVLAGLVGNIAREPSYLLVFAMYFVPTAAVVAVMFLRDRILLLVLHLSGELVGRVTSLTGGVSQWARRAYDDINSQSIIFFTRGDDAANLNRAMLYVRANEHTKRIRVVHVHKAGSAPPPRLESDLKFLDEVYPEIDIEFMALEGTFGPDLIETLSQRFKVPRNYMFIGCPGNSFPHNIDDLGGVRLIV